MKDLYEIREVVIELSDVSKNTNISTEMHMFVFVNIIIIIIISPACFG